MSTCKNVKNKTYTGKENTPLGKGYHASGEKIGTFMKGRDKNIYKVVKTKTGKRWQKISDKSPKRSVRGLWSSIKGPETLEDIDSQIEALKARKRQIEEGFEEDFEKFTQEDVIEIKREMAREQLKENLEKIKELENEFWGRKNKKEIQTKIDELKRVNENLNKYIKYNDPNEDPWFS